MDENRVGGGEGEVGGGTGRRRGREEKLQWVWNISN